MTTNGNQTWKARPTNERSQYVPGWYWWRPAATTGGFVVNAITAVYLDSGGMVHIPGRSILQNVANMVGGWFGPIRPPD